MSESKEELLNQLITESENEAAATKADMVKKGFLSIALGVVGFIVLIVYGVLANERDSYFLKELVLVGVVGIASVAGVLGGSALLIHAKKCDGPEEE